MVETKQPFHNRRQGPDTLVKSINIFVLISLFLIFLIIILVLLPESTQQYLTYRKLNTLFGETWRVTVMRYAFYLMIIQFIVSTIGIIFNSSRHRRRNDKYKYSLIFFGFLSLLGIILYLVLA